MTALLRYLERCGIEFDVATNVLLGGALGQTISLRTALAARAGKRWGCVGCRMLSVLVQPGHCAKQFVPGSAGPLTYIRAGIAFAVGGAAMFGAVHAVEALVWLAF